MTFSCLSPRNWVTQGTAVALRLGSVFCIGATTVLLGHSAPAMAAEELVFTYGPFRPSFSVAELEEFAETGNVPSSLRFYLRVANVDSEVLRTILTEELTLSLKLVDDVLNTIPGEFALFEIGQIVHTPSRQANIQALRAAMVLSVSEDNKISFLEFLKNYPTQQVYVDGVNLARVASDVGDVVEDVRDRLRVWVTVIEDFLSVAVCECEADPVAATDP